MRLYEFSDQQELTEIDYTPGIEPLQISVDELVSNAVKIGDIDNRDVFKYDNGTAQIYFTRSDDKVAGLIILQQNKLRGIRNYSGLSGLITMLVGFVTHRLGTKVEIENSEPFTPSGITWLRSLIAAGGRGLTIKDQSGNFPDADKLRLEWTAAMTGNVGPTSLTIESKMTRKLNTKVENVAEGRLMPATWFIGDRNIL